MVDPNYFALLNQEEALIAHCLLTDDAHTTMKSAIALSGTSKVYNTIIRSEPFFKMVLKLIDPQHPFFSADVKLKQSQEEKETSFKHKYFELRNIFLQKEESFPGILFGTAFPREDGVELISFHDGIKSYMLKENSSCQSINLPEDMKIPPREIYRESPCAARSDKFLAINQRSDSAIYIYEANGEKYLARYLLDGEISELHIKNNRLFVVEKDPNDLLNLVVFNLELPESQSPVIISLPKSEILRSSFKQICFNEKYLIYTQRLQGLDQISALPLSSLQTGKIEWITEKMVINQYRLMVSNGDSFMELSFNSCTHCYDFSKVSITSEGFQKKKIAQNITFFEIDKICLTDVCFHNDRIFFAYENFKGTKIFSYDIISQKVSEPIVISTAGSNHPFNPRFLSIATNVYYLIMGLGTIVPAINKVELKTHLLTLMYGKV